MYSIVILGVPNPQKRPRFARMGRFVKTFDPDKSLKKDIIEGFTGQLPDTLISTPIRVEARFYFPHRTSHYRSNGTLKDKSFIKSTKPDLDNLIKFILDTLNGVIWVDDSLIVELVAGKYYDEKPRTELYIRSYEDNERTEN